MEMRPFATLFGAAVLIGSLSSSSVTAAPVGPANSLVGNFDLIDWSDNVVGHVITEFQGPTSQQEARGHFDVTWVPGASFPFTQQDPPIIESHAQLDAAWFGPGESGISGDICDVNGLGISSCHDFSVVFVEDLAAPGTGVVGFADSLLGDPEHPWWYDYDVFYRIGHGAFVVQYIGPSGKSLGNVRVTVAGPSQPLRHNDSWTFSATVTGASNTAVTWSILEPSGGSITEAGVYTAPDRPGTFTVAAVSQADGRAWGIARVSVVCGTPVSVPGSALPGGPARFEPPDGYSYFGFMYRLWESDDPAWGDTRVFSDRICDAVDIELAGKTPATLFAWNGWQSADGTAQPFSTVQPDLDRIHAALGPGVVPMLEWTANTETADPSAPYSGITTKDIAGGSLDAYIRQYARDVKQYGDPLFIRLICGEFNGDWWPWCSPNANPDLSRADFVNAWRRVVDIFRQQGVTNVAWLWNPVAPAPWAEDAGWDVDWAAYYPGDAYVDWVGADLNDWGQPAWLDPVYEFAVGHGKPLFLTEFAIRDGLSDHTQIVAWLGTMLDYVENHPQIKAISVCNYKTFAEDDLGSGDLVWLYDGQVNYRPDVNDLDTRLLAGGPDIRTLFADRISIGRYISTLVTSP
jgi:hypothetical protein